MSHLDMHDAIDRLDAGLPDQPRLAAIVAGGRRRRRRTRTLLGVAGLATVAGVAQVAFLAGSHQAPASASGASGAAGSPVPSSGIFDSQVEAAVRASLPGVEPEHGASDYLKLYQVEGYDQLVVNMSRGPEAAGAMSEECDAAQGCTQTQEGDLLVRVTDHADGPDDWVRSVRVAPVEGPDGPAWTTIVSAASSDIADQAGADETLPSLQTLTDLAIQLAQLPQ